MNPSLSNEISLKILRSRKEKINLIESNEEPERENLSDIQAEGKIDQRPQVQSSQEELLPIQILKSDRKLDLEKFPIFEPIKLQKKIPNSSHIEAKTEPIDIIPSSNFVSNFEPENNNPVPILQSPSTINSSSNKSPVIFNKKETENPSSISLNQNHKSKHEKRDAKRSKSPSESSASEESDEIKKPPKKHHTKKARNSSSSSSDKSRNYKKKHKEIKYNGKKSTNLSDDSEEDSVLIEKKSRKKEKTRSMPSEDYKKETSIKKSSKNYEKNKEIKGPSKLSSSNSYSSDFENIDEEFSRKRDINYKTQYSKHSKKKKSVSRSSSSDNEKRRVIIKKRQHRHRHYKKSYDKGSKAKSNLDNQALNKIMQLLAAVILNQKIEPSPQKKGKIPKSRPKISKFPGITDGPTRNIKPASKKETVEPKYIKEKKIWPEERKFPSRGKKLNIPPYQYVVSLVIGQTGSGKSTFINTITNFFRNGTLQNKKIAIPTKEFPQTEFDFKHTESGKRHDESQTISCCRYDFLDPSTASTFTFIDTPGLSDTRGVEQDDENLKIIVNEIIKYPDINAIIIVQNGSEARKTASVKNALVRIRNALPKVVEQNIILVLTNSSLSSNFNIESLQVAPKNQFVMDNNAFNIPDPESLNEYDLFDLQNCWDRSIRKIKEIAEYLCSMGTFSTRCFKEMIEEVDKAKQSFHQAKAKLFNLYSLMEQLEEIKTMKELSINDAKAYQNFVKTKTIEQIEWIDVNYHNTVCSNDESLCHEKCGLEYTPQNNGTHFSDCSCMGTDKRCKICSCGPESHYHTKKIPRKTQKNVEEVLQDMKDKFDSFNMKANQYGQKEIGISSDMQRVQRSIDDTKNEIRAAVQRLKQVAPHYNIADEIDSIIQQSKMQLKQETRPKERSKIIATARVLEEIYQSLNFG